MNEINLCDSLVELVKETVKNFRLLNKNGEAVTPKVYSGFLPLKNDEEVFPYVLVRHEKSSTDWEGTNCSVSIIAGSFCDGKGSSGIEGEDMNGQKDCLLVLSAIRTALLELPAETLAKRYVLMPKIDIDIHSEQAFPYWQADMTTNWFMPQPAMQHIRSDF